MKNMTLILSAIAIFFGCSNEPNLLDWNKTANQQNLEIGDTIRVEGEVYDKIGNPYKTNFDFGSENYLFQVKQGWEAKTHTSVYNPKEPDSSGFNPNAPIGVVICTIYNPSAYESLQRIDDMYPTKTKDFFTLVHKFIFDGTIYSFEKEFVKGYQDRPDAYLSSVRIHVTDLTYIGTRDWEKELKKSNQEQNSSE